MALRGGKRWFHHTEHSSTCGRIYYNWKGTAAQNSPPEETVHGDRAQTEKEAMKMAMRLATINERQT
eukprot:4815555-Pyramimonas_sp.AAC.1